MNIKKQGYLMKFSSGVLGAKWKKVWVDLLQDSTIKWFEKQGDLAPTRTVNLKRVAYYLAVGATTENIPFRPDIPKNKIDQLLAIPHEPSRKSRISYFLFNDAVEMNEWMENIFATMPQFHGSKPEDNNSQAAINYIEKNKLNETQPPSNYCAQPPSYSQFASTSVGHQSGGYQGQNLQASNYGIPPAVNAYGGVASPIGSFGGPQPPPMGGFNGQQPPIGSFGGQQPPIGSFGGQPPTIGFGGAFNVQQPPMGSIGGHPPPMGVFGGQPQSVSFGGGYGSTQNNYGSAPPPIGFNIAPTSGGPLQGSGYANPPPPMNAYPGYGQPSASVGVYPGQNFSQPMNVYQGQSYASVPTSVVTYTVQQQTPITQQTIFVSGKKKKRKGLRNAAVGLAAGVAGAYVMHKAMHPWGGHHHVGWGGGMGWRSGSWSSLSSFGSFSSGGSW